MTKTANAKSGFTLVELSIVLVIIGLIIGGVLVGRDLIRTAENRAFVAQLEKFNTAINTFRSKYGCLPGDCANATSFGFTGNGDGNGAISALWDASTWTNATDYGVGPGGTILVYDNSGCNCVESKYLWKHLQSAGLLGGSGMGSFQSPDTLYSDTLPVAKNDGLGIVIVTWNGKHYFRPGVTSFDDAFGGPGAPIQTNFALNYSPSDAAYIYNKTNGGHFTAGNTNNPSIPDGIYTGDRIIPVGFIALFPRFFYYPVSQGAGGAAANVCVDTSVTPNFFNVKNPNKLCGLLIRADF